MNDNFPNYLFKVFLDTNVILEGLALQSQPWEEIDSNGPILVVLTPTLLSEVDSKKKDGRLAPKAREFNRLVAPLAINNEPISLRESEPRVDMVIGVCNRIDWATYDDLDRSEGDDRIIAETLNMRGMPHNQKLVVSQDINPLIKAGRHDLRTKHLSDRWLPKPETSAKDKEIERLKRELESHRKSEPEFLVEFEAATTAKTYRIKELEGDQLALLERSIIARHPKPSQSRDPFGLAASALSAMQYDDSLNHRYGKYTQKVVPEFCRQYQQLLEVFYGQVPFAFSIRNTGNVRADHLSVRLKVMGGWINSRPIAVSTAGPNAPLIRNPMLHRVDNLSNFRVPDVRRLPVGRHEIEVSEVRRTTLLSAECEDFHSGQQWTFRGSLWLDPHYERAPTVVVEATAANFHGTHRKILKIDRTVEARAASELVNFETGARIVDPKIWPLIAEALEKNRFADIEWLPPLSND